MDGGGGGRPEATSASAATALNAGPRAVAVADETAVHDTTTPAFSLWNH
jgi:hypothetical protein